MVYSKDCGVQYRPWCVTSWRVQPELSSGSQQAGDSGLAAAYTGPTLSLSLSLSRLTPNIQIYRERTIGIKHWSHCPIGRKRHHSVQSTLTWIKTLLYLYRYILVLQLKISAVRQNKNVTYCNLDSRSLYTLLLGKCWGCARCDGECAGSDGECAGSDGSVPVVTASWRSVLPVTASRLPGACAVRGETQDAARADNYTFGQDCGCGIIIIVIIFIIIVFIIIIDPCN